MKQTLSLLGLILLSFVSFSQDYLTVDIFSIPGMVTSLSDLELNFTEAEVLIWNTSQMDLIVSFETINHSIPDGWDLDPDLLKLNDGEYVIVADELISTFHLLELFILDLESAELVGTQEVRITAKTPDLTEVYNETIEINYEFEPVDLGSPSFTIEDFNSAVFPDTIAIEVEVVDDFFIGCSHFFYHDDTWISRYIAIEPLEIITENIDELFCNDNINRDPNKSLCNGESIEVLNSNLSVFFFNGTFETPSPNWKLELLINFYDPLDSLNSNQTIRFIGKDIACETPSKDTIIDLPAENRIFCRGEDIELNVLPGFRDVNWADITDDVRIVVGPSLTISDIQGTHTVSVQALNDNGCQFTQTIQLTPLESAEIIDEDSLQSNYCFGDQVELVVNNGFSNIQVTNESTGEIYDGDNLSFIFEEKTFITVVAQNEEGCELSSTIFLDLNKGTPAQFFDGDFYAVCKGSSFSLEANSAFENIRILNESPGVSIIGNILSIDHLDEPIYVELHSDGSSTCGNFQDVQFFPIELETDDIVPGDIATFSNCINTRFTAASEYTNIRWFVRNTGQNTFDQFVDLGIVTQTTTIIVSGTKVDGDGCVYKQEIILEPVTEGFDSEIVKTDLTQNFCSIVDLEALEGFDAYIWSILEGNSERVIATGRSTSLDFSDSDFGRTLSLRLNAISNSGCNTTQDFVIDFGAEEGDLIVANNQQPFCFGETIQLSTNRSYSEYNWLTNGLSIDSPTIEVTADGSTITLEVRDDEGCYFSQQIENLIEPAMPSLCQVTYDNTIGQNILSWITPPLSSNISHYVVLRQADSSINLDSVGIVENVTDNQYQDSTADPSEKTYSYALAARDFCGNLSQFSNVKKTLHLQSTGGGDDITLLWQSLIGVNFNELRILRGSSPDELAPYDTVMVATLSYTDPDPLIGDAYYQLELTGSSTCTNNAIEIVQSNIIELLKSDSTEDLDLGTKIYPNPFRNQLIVESDRHIDIEIISAQGVSLNSQTLESGRHTLDTSDLLEGLYLLKVQVEKAVLSEIFIKI